MFPVGRWNTMEYHDMRYKVIGIPWYTTLFIKHHQAMEGWHLCHPQSWGKHHEVGLELFSSRPKMLLLESRPEIHRVSGTIRPNRWSCHDSGLHYSPENSYGTEQIWQIANFNRKHHLLDPLHVRFQQSTNGIRPSSHLCFFRNGMMNETSLLLGEWWNGDAWSLRA